MDIQVRLLRDYSKAILVGAGWVSHDPKAREEAKKYAMELYESRQKIIAYVQELEAKLADYENHLDELEQERGA